MDPEGCEDYANIVRNFYYEDCKILVGFRVVICPGQGITVKLNYYIYDSATECLKLKKKIFKAFITGGEVAAMDLLNDIVRKLTLYAESDALNGIKDRPINPFPCNQSGGYVMKFQESECRNLCATWDPNVGDEMEGIWNLSEELCGSGCCVRNTPFCIDENRNIITGVSTKTSIGTCEPVNINCPGGSTPGILCRPPCYRL